MAGHSLLWSEWGLLFFFVCAKDPLQPLAWNIKLLIPITSTNEFKNIFHNRSLIKGVPTYFPEEWRQPQCEDFWVLSLQVIQRSPDHLRVITKSHPSQRVTFLFPTQNWFALNWYPIVIMGWGDHCFVISCPLISRRRQLVKIYQSRRLYFAHFYAIWMAYPEVKLYIMLIFLSWNSTHLNLWFVHSFVLNSIVLF